MNPKEIKKFIKKCAAIYDNGSPFSALRENEIAKLIEQHRLFTFTGGDLISGDSVFADDALTAVVIARVLDRDTTHRDFAQRTRKFAAGSLWISGIFIDTLRDFTVGDVAYTLQRISAHFQVGEINVECYAENDLLIETLKSLGFERVMTKVSAFAEVKVIYSNVSPEWSEVHHEYEDATLLTIDDRFLTDGHHRIIMQELDDALQHAEFANHYSIYNKDDKWSGLTLRGYKKEDPGFIEKPSEMSKRWKKENEYMLDLKCVDTILAEHFVSTMRLIRAWFGEIERVRILRLDQQGVIMRHCDIQDKEAGLAIGKIVRLHIPLKTHDKVTFKSWDVNGKLIEMQMRERSLCYLDHRKPHSVINDGGERLHLVIDVYSTSQIQQMVASAFARQPHKGEQ